jgi:two-component system response regulator FixJ
MSERPVAGVHERKVPAASPSALTLHVAVIDDDTAARTSMMRLLDVSGYVAHGYEHGQAMLDEPAPERFSCLVMDLQMPGLSGLDVQRVLQQRGVATPIIFLSAFGTVATSVRAMRTGALDFLEKPADPSALLASVARAAATAGDRVARQQQRRDIERRRALLTAREWDVFEGVVQGLPNKQIGAALGIALKTVKVHRGRVMQKMEAGSVADLVRAAEMLADEKP